MSIRLPLGPAALAAWTSWMLLALPAEACTTCSLDQVGNSTEVSTVAGSATLFNSQGKFLIQTGINLRDITGSFNDRSGWTAKPQNSSLLTLQGNLGVTYYPSEGWTMGIQVPMALNRLDGAQWGGQGAVVPVNADDGIIGPQTGGGVGDINLQGSYVCFKDEVLPSVALWAGAILPSGSTAGGAAAFTGSGIFSGQAGLSLFKRFGPLELSMNLGYQHPLSQPQQAISSAFFVGDALVGHLQTNMELVPTLRLGLGATTFRGWITSANVAPSAANMSKLKLIPSVEWQFLPDHGVRLAYGGDPGIGPWLNSMTDNTVYAIYYRFF